MESAPHPEVPPRPAVGSRFCRLMVIDSPVRVGVVDDHPSIVAAISGAVGAAPDLTLAGTGRSLSDAVGLLDQVDVLLCDVQLEGRAEGLRLLEAARGTPH